MALEFTGNPKPFGIIGLVLAILSLLFSVIPCVGFYAFGPALIGFFFALIAFLHARQTKINFSVPLAGMIIGGLAMGIAIFQYVHYNEVFKAKKEFDKGIHKMDSVIVNKALDTLEKSIQQSAKDDSINKAAKDTLKKW